MSESPLGTTGNWVAVDADRHPTSNGPDTSGETVLSEETVSVEDGSCDTDNHQTGFTKVLLEKMKAVMNVEKLDEETTRMVKRLVIIRISTKHINLWMRQLEMKRKEMSELAGLMNLEWIKEEIQKEKSLERWARRCSNNFP